MRTRCFSILMVILVANSAAHSQLVRSYGIKLGAVSANQTWENTSAPDLTTSYRWGITGGVYLEFLDIPLLSLVGEIQYTQKGMTFSAPVTTALQPNGTGQFISLSPRVDYLSIPILAKLRLKSPFFTPYLIAGPRVDLLVYKKGDGFDPVIDQIKSTDVGGTVGVGSEFNTPLAIGILAEIRYNASFRDSFKNEFLSVRNHSFDFLLGLRL